MSALSTDILRRNEGRLGLLPCKVRVNLRLVLYHAGEAREALIKAGVIRG
jgi:hypothetical protein